MKANVTPLLVFFLLAFLCLSSCTSRDELLSLSKCEFRVLDAENITLGGVPIEGVNSLSDLNPLQLLSLAAQANAGELPLSMNILVEIKNPNKDMAALSKAEWIFIVDDRQLTTGIYEERVEIPGNDGLAVASVPVSANLVALLEGDSNEALINLALNLADIGEQPSRILFRVKPFIKVGNKLIAYPGYVDIRTEFTSGE